MTTETHIMTASNNGATINVSQELVDYLRTQPEIRPLKAVFKNAIFANGVMNAAFTWPIILSGMNETILGGSHLNWFRMAQGALGTTNLVCQTALQTWARYHTYQDLRDLQKGINPAIIIDRVEARNHSPLHNTLSGWAANSVNFTAKFAMGMCGLMFMSGVTSGRPGEAVAAMLFIPALAVRLVPERTSPDRARFDADMAAAKNKPVLSRTIGDHGLVTLNAVINSDSYINKGINLTVEFMRKAVYKAGLSQAKITGSSEENFLQKLATRPPLVISGLYNSVKRLPDFFNALYLMDGGKLVQHGDGFACDASLMGVDKRYIGRSNGSILTAPDDAEVAQNILEGRIFRALNEATKWDPVKYVFK